MPEQRQISGQAAVNVEITKMITNFHIFISFTFFLFSVPLFFIIYLTIDTTVSVYEENYAKEDGQCNTNKVHQAKDLNLFTSKLAALLGNSNFLYGKETTIKESNYYIVQNNFNDFLRFEIEFRN